MTELPEAAQRRTARTGGRSRAPGASTQGGFLSLLYSIGSKPLQIWDKQVQNGHIKRLTDEDIQSSVLEVLGANVRARARSSLRGGGGLLRRVAARTHNPHAAWQVSTTYISCPADANETLGIKMPYLVMIIKNMRKYFSFEVQACARSQPQARGAQLSHLRAGDGRQGHQTPLSRVQLPGAPASPRGCAAVRQPCPHTALTPL